MAANISRCQASLAACPAGGARHEALQAWLARSFGLFAASSAAPTPAAAGTLTACVASYSLAHALTYALVLHAVWLCERAARLAFLACTDHYDLEWALERLGSGRAPVVLALELAATLAILSFCVQAVVPVAMAWLGY